LGAAAGRGVEATVRRWRDFLPEFIVLPHPSWRNTAWIQRNGWFEDELTPFLRERIRELLS